MSQENGIGQDFALFYIAYAAYLELRGNFAKAEAVFEAGLEKCARQIQLGSQLIIFILSDG